MDKVWIIAKKDIKEAIHSKTTYLYIAVLCFMSIRYFQVIKDALNSLSKQGESLAGLRYTSQSLMNIDTYTMPLVLTMLVCGFFANTSVVMDKAKRTLEPLMATPLSLRQVWLGKSLAVAVPSLLIALPVSVIVLVIMDVAVIMPKVDTFIIPSAMSIVTSLLIMPLTAFFVVTIVTFLQLTIANPRIANLVFSAIFLGIFIYINTITRATASWYFAFIYLSAMLVLVGIMAILDSILTKEKIVLSSKE